MAMQNSAEVVRELINDISKACTGLRNASMAINQASGGDWEDEQSQQYSAAMKRLAGLLNEPVSTLEGCGKQLIHLANTLENYSRIHFE